MYVNSMNDIKSYVPISGNSILTVNNVKDKYYTLFRVKNNSPLYPQQQCQGSFMFTIYSIREDKGLIKCDYAAILALKRGTTTPINYLACKRASVKNYLGFAVYLLTRGNYTYVLFKRDADIGNNGCEMVRLEFCSEPQTVEILDCTEEFVLETGEKPTESIYPS